MVELPPLLELAALRKRREAEVQGLLEARAQVDALSQALGLLEGAVRRLGLKATTEALDRETAGELPDVGSGALGALQDETDRSFESLRRQVIKLRADVDGGLSLLASRKPG